MKGLIKSYPPDFGLEPCGEGCATCSGTGNDQCLTCPDGFFHLKENESDDTGQCLDCHASCNGCLMSKNPIMCLNCVEPTNHFFKLQESDDFGSCLNCHESCNGCTMAENPFKCLNCPNDETLIKEETEEDGMCSGYEPPQINQDQVDPELDPETDPEFFQTQLKLTDCSGMTVPGCDECGPQEKGCQMCQPGAGIEIIDGYQYCVKCPKNCAVCENTLQGRQCQKCFTGFVFNSLTQQCYKWLLNSFITVLLIFTLLK